MKKWTTQTEQRLTEYLDERASREGFAGEDAAELKDDLRRHIHEEAEKLDGEVIGVVHLENILARLDAGYRPVGGRVAAVPASRVQGGFLKWTFGVILPLGVLVFEAIASFCGSVFFSPVPTWWHVAWIALVPILNIWLLRGTGKESSRGAAAGFVLFTTMFYGLLFLPIIHLSVMALIFFGLGMISLTPIFAAITSWRIGRTARLSSPEPARFKTGWRIGVLAGVVSRKLKMRRALSEKSFWRSASDRPSSSIIARQVAGSQQG